MTYKRLNKDDAVVLLVDHQTGLISLVQDFSPNEFKNNVLTLAALAEGFEVFVVTDASGTFNEAVQRASWARMSAAGAHLVNWFSVACELQVDWRNDMEGLANLLSPRIPNYRNLMNSYSAFTAK
jgi:nicotinamidase-related amidase